MTDFEDETTGSGTGSADAAPSTDPATSNQPTDFAHASQSWDASPATGSAGPPGTRVENTASFDGDKGPGGTPAQTKRVREVLSDAKTVMQRNYRVASDTADDFVHDSPWQAIGMAAFGGLLVGMLINR